MSHKNVLVSKEKIRGPRKNYEFHFIYLNEKTVYSLQNNKQ